MPGPPPKPPERRQRRNGGGGKAARRVELAPARTADQVPAAPTTWLAATKTQWRVFWTSEIARLVDAETHRPAVTRLFSLLDERERAYRAFQKERLVRGSTGQWVVNPLWRQVPVMDAEIRQLEDRFGLTPQSQLKLGLTFGHAAKSLEDVNRRLNEDRPGDGTDQGEGEADPRLLRLAK